MKSPIIRRLPTIKEKAIVRQPVTPPEFISLVVTLPDGTVKEVNYINQRTLPPDLRQQTAKAIVNALYKPKSGDSIFDVAMGEALGRRLLEI